MDTDLHGCSPKAAVVDESSKGIFQFQSFSRIQSKCARVVYGSDKNLVFSVPPYSGKYVSISCIVLRRKCWNSTCEVQKVVSSIY